MPGETAYCIFPTDWGYFGFLALDGGLSRTSLPLADSREVEDQLLDGARAAHCKTLFCRLQDEIRAYFQGQTIEFKEVPRLAPAHSTDFARSVYSALRTVGPGKTITYADLARRCGAPGASRAVGGVMARNPLPLIVPCHRVIRTDGSLGGFSAPGGVCLKQRLLGHETMISGGR